MLPPNYIDCEQGSKAWFDCRLGAVTSSRIADVVAKRKPKKGQSPDEVEELACRRNLRWDLVGELLTGKPTEHYVSRWMKEGKEKEPLARTEYEIQFGVFVEQVGFCYHPMIRLAGASPDGLVGEVGLVEFKCPTLQTHLEYLANDVIPDEYLPQLVWQLACDEDRAWVDFVSFHPDMPDECRLFIKRLPRNEEVCKLIAAYVLEVEQFNKEVQGVVESIRAKHQMAVAV